MSTQFTSSIEAGSISNANVSGKVQENLHLIEKHLGAESMLLQQLRNCESSYKSLTERLAAIEPTLSTLDTSVQSLTTTESSLLGGLSGFCEKLAEAQIQPSNPGLESELSNKYVENTQLQLQLQDISLKAASLLQRVDECEAQNLAMQQSLTEATAECQKAETLNRRIESEKLALQGEAALAEQKIRHELTSEITRSTDRIRHEYEQKLQRVQKEKNDLENGSEEVLAQLGGVRDSLVSAFLDRLVTITLTTFRWKPRVLLMRSAEIVRLWYISTSFPSPSANSVFQYRLRRLRSRFKSSPHPAPRLWLSWILRQCSSNSIRK